MIKKIGILFIFLLVGGYISFISISYFRSTFFIYPNIKEKYEIVGKVDTPEEALEVCRSNFESIYDGKRINLVRERVWDGMIRFIEKEPMKEEKVRLFQIRVSKNFNKTWSIISTIETDDSKECFICPLKIGPQFIGRCNIDSDGKLTQFN